MKLFRFLAGLVFLHAFVVDDAGGGSGESDDNIDDIGNLDLDGADGDGADGDGDGADGDGANDDGDGANDEVKTMQKTIEEQQKFIDEQRNKEAVQTAVSEIKAKHNDFDESKVLEHLKKLHETDPQKAQMLNNPVGWENIWYEIRPVKPSNDPFSHARNTEPVDRDSDVFDAVKAGGVTLSDEKDVLGKYL